MVVLHCCDCNNDIPGSVLECAARDVSRETNLMIGGFVSCETIGLRETNWLKNGTAGVSRETPAGCQGGKLAKLG